jgi:hypothetical protein
LPFPHELDRRLGRFVETAVAGERVKAFVPPLPTVHAALAQLQTLGIVKEITGRKRGRVFVYSAYLDILSEGRSYEALSKAAGREHQPERVKPTNSLRTLEEKWCRFPESNRGPHHYE